MVTVDLVGLAVTVALIGGRYPVHALAAILIHEFGKLAAAVFLGGRIEAIVAAGAFGSATLSGTQADLGQVLIPLGGILANLLLTGAEAVEEWRFIPRLAARVTAPLAMASLRLSILAAAVVVWNQYVQR